MSGLDHAGLTVHDLDRSIRFYGEVLGCIVEERAVISGAEAGELVRLVGPAGHPLFRHPDCSVLVVR